MGTSSLTPIRSLQERITAWEKIAGIALQCFVGDITDYSFLSAVMVRFKPEVIVHFAEQRSAPF